MSQNQNISTRNALCRFTMGLSMLSCGTAKLVRNPYSTRGLVFVVLGAMKTAEGTLRYCPVKAMLQRNGMMGHTGEDQIGKMMKEFTKDGMSVTT